MCAVYVITGDERLELTVPDAPHDNGQPAAVARLLFKLNKINYLAHRGLVVSAAQETIYVKRGEKGHNALEGGSGTQPALPRRLYSVEDAQTSGRDHRTRRLRPLVELSCAS